MQDNKIFKPKEDGGCYEILILKISPRTTVVNVTFYFDCGCYIAFIVSYIIISSALALLVGCIRPVNSRVLVRWWR